QAVLVADGELVGVASEVVVLRANVRSLDQARTHGGGQADEGVLDFGFSTNVRLELGDRVLEHRLDETEVVRSGHVGALERVQVADGGAFLGGGQGHAQGTRSVHEAQASVLVG